MDKLHEMSEAFKFQYEKFINGCDALEANGDWDVSVDGDMETYYFNDIMCVIIKLISADGKFSDEEAQYINDAFGFRYSSEELAELFRMNGSDISRMVKDEIPAGVKRLESINPKLADHYKNMLCQICDIIAESDGIIHVSESSQIESIKASLNT